MKSTQNLPDEQRNSEQKSNGPLAQQYQEQGVFQTLLNNAVEIKYAQQGVLNEKARIAVANEQFYGFAEKLLVSDNVRIHNMLTNAMIKRTFSGPVHPMNSTPSGPFAVMSLVSSLCTYYNTVMCYNSGIYGSRYHRNVCLKHVIEAASEAVRAFYKETDILLDIDAIAKQCLKVEEGKE
jgi:hypothetical protein